MAPDDYVVGVVGLVGVVGVVGVGRMGAAIALRLLAQGRDVVAADASSEALARVEGMLTEEEAQVVRRARNAHQTPPRGALRAEYHRATALEALIGYLYVMGRGERMSELLDAAVGDVNEG